MIWHCTRIYKYMYRTHSWSIHAIHVFVYTAHTHIYIYPVLWYSIAKSSRKQAKASASATAQAAAAALLCHYSMEIHYNRLLVWSRLYCVPNMPKCWLLLVVCLIRNWLWMLFFLLCTYTNNQNKRKASEQKRRSNQMSKSGWICKVRDK